jgi:microcystin-dependent protein
MPIPAIIGDVVIFPYQFTPQGYLPCDGQLLPISEYSTLFMLIGTRFGGDGKETFALPNYAGKAPVGSRYFISAYGKYPQD